MKRLLVCPPDYYTVNYEINPWMHTRAKPDKKLALSQWQNLHEKLLSLGLDVVQIGPQEGLPDMVFAANGGLVYKNKFIVSNFRYPQREGEARHFSAWFQREGYEVLSLPEDCYFEGEGDAFIVDDTLVAGFRFRSDIRSHKIVGEMLGKRVISLELANPDFYHLDTCFAPLDKVSALYYPDALDSYGQKALAHLIPELVEVGQEDALKFCCNAVVIGRDIIMNSCSDILQKRLEERGFNLHQLDFGEYIKAGGSAKCLVLCLDRYDQQ